MTHILFRDNDACDAFWTVIAKLHDYSIRADRWDAYYNEGYCGGCETCLSAAPSCADTSLEELEGLVAELRAALLQTEVVQ
jgi:hypothetical protein